MSVACKKRIKTIYTFSRATMYTTEIFIPLLQIVATNEVREPKTVFLFKQ